MARKRMRSRADALAKPAASARAVQHAAPAKEHREAAVAAQRRASEKKPRLEKIRGLESELLAQGSSKANNLVELLESLRSEDTVVAKAALHSLRRLFTCGCAALDAAMRPAAAAAAAADADEADAPDAAAKAANIYDTWIRDRYADYKQDLLARLAGTAKELQTVSMVVMLQLAKQESAAPGGDGLAVGTLTQVLRTLLLRTSHNADAVLKMFVRNFASEYDDVRFHVLKAAKAVLGGLRQQSTDSEALEAVHRALTLLLSVRIPEATRERLDNFWFSLEGETSDQGPKKKQKTTSEPRGKRVTQVRSHRKAFADCWMELLQIRGLDVASYRRVLLGMHDQILPHLPHPLLLSDFLTDAYNHGGAVSMLAMHGLFILMATHGLEYPQFYPRLYALMTPSIFHLAHRDQFFRLTDLFLTSKGAQPVGVCCC
jgi:U3 small nucleolar RNA-associated protein 19